MMLSGLLMWRMGCWRKGKRYRVLRQGRQPLSPVQAIPKPVPEATISNAGRPYETEQNAEFALKRKKGISADTHEVVERAGYGWFIVPKGSAVPPVAPPPLTPVPEHQAEPVPPTPAVAPPAPPAPVAAPADLPVDIPPREETVPPLAPAPLPDYAQGIPEGAQVPLVRPTAQDAERLIVQAQETMRELAQLHRVRARAPQDVYDTAVRMRERLAQYERELTPAQDDLRTQLANVDRNYANFLQGIDPHESVEAQAEHLTARMSEMTRSPQKTEAIRPLAEAMFLRAKTLLEEGLNPKVYDKLANATRVLRARVRPSAPPAPPVPPVPVAPEPPALPEPIAAPPPALPAPRRAARLGQTAMERLVDAAETLLAHTPPAPVVDLRALLEQVRTAQQQLPTTRLDALVKETLRDALADVAQRLNLAVVRRADEEPPEPAVTPAPPAPTPPAPTAAAQPFSPDVAFDRLVRAIQKAISTGERRSPLQTIRDLQTLADAAYGGTRAGGEYDTRDLYDAMEVALNQEVQRLSLTGVPDPMVDLAQAQAHARFLHELSGKLPTQTVRTAEQDALQQFSTPLDYAYAAAWVANLQPTDVVLEPSAGTGTLAGMARLVVGGKVHTNEIAERRLMALAQQGYQHVTKEDALFLHSLLHNKLDPPPTVVLMNPPFSMAAEQRIKSNQTGANHVEQALKLLPPGGRLVAIVGRGMRPYDPAAPKQYREGTGQEFEGWWKKIARQHTVRANIGVSGDVYQKQGTHFATRLLVIDAGTPTAQNSILTGDVETIPDLLALLEGVRHVRAELPAQPAPQRGSAPAPGQGPVQPTTKPSRPVDAVGAGGGEGSRVPRTPGVSGGGARGDVGLEQPAGGAVPAPTTSGRPGGGGRPAPGRPGAPEPVAGSAAPPEPTARPVGDRQPGLPTPEQPPERVPGGLTPSNPPRADEPRPADPRPPETPTQQDAATADLTTSIFEPYLPQRVQIAGAQPHPGALVQSAAMASVPAPFATYEPHLPPDVITEGRLSLPQLESIIYAGQAHAQELPDGKRRGFAIGDGTGVGKGREIAGIIYDNWLQGRTKALWITKNYDLHAAAQKDWADVTGRSKKDVFTLHRPATKMAEPIRQTEGILFLPYDTMKAFNKKNPEITRVKQAVTWLGPDFDGVVVFDEAHLMGGEASGGDDDLFGHKASQRAQAGQALRDALPHARIVYLSATSATEVRNLGYLDRLGLWGVKTPFTSKSDFMVGMAAGGVAAMEVVARDMKAMGVYMARSLSYEGIQYDRIEKQFDEAAIAGYDRIAEAWRVITKEMEKALETTGAQRGSRAQIAAMSNFYRAEQDFFNQLITALKTPEMIAHIETYIHDPAGGAAVIQLTNTNAATQERRLAQMEEGDTLEDLTLSPMDILMEYVQGSFPTAQQVTRTTDDGSVITETLKDSQGRPVENPEAVAQRNALLNDLAALQADIPDGPLEQLLDHFGPETVAEVTGRQERLVYRENAQGQRVRMREDRTEAHISQDVKDYMDDKKRILVFSGKGGTGMSYHASLEVKNQRLREHYALQPGWRADTAVQGFGRSHRTNQAQPPRYHLVTTDLPAEKRFTSSIARRLDQLGALSRGQRQASSTGLFTERDNLESQWARDALKRYLKDLAAGRNVSLSLDEFRATTGLDPESKKAITIERFLNRLFMFPVATQHAIFQDFSARLDQTIELAIQEDRFDVGMETIKADRITKLREQSLATDPTTGAETQYVELKIENKPDPLHWEEIPMRLNILGRGMPGSQVGEPVGYLTNNQSGKVYLVSTTLPKADPKTGDLIPMYRRHGVASETLILQADLTKERYTIVPDAQAQALWERDIAALPEFVASTEHLIAGVLLPHWDKFPESMTKVYRLQTTAGERLLGRVIPPSQLPRVLQNFGAVLEGQEGGKAVPRYTPEEAIDRVVRSGRTFRISNGWTLAPSRIGGSTRVEVKHVSAGQRQELEADGVLFERIGYNAHYFLPTGVRGVEVYERIMQNKLLAEELGPQSDD